jgi:hypothetical protein
MAQPAYATEHVQRFLLDHQIATLPELKAALGTAVDLTVFRKLKTLGALTSYSHRGAYYTLPTIARFDALGLWACRDVWFSRHGTLLATTEHHVTDAARGLRADELAAMLHVQVHDALLRLVEQRRITRQLVGGVYLYTARDAAVRRRQVAARRVADAVPMRTDAPVIEVAGDEVKAAIVLFYSLLDEQQRRLYAGLESLRLGHGGDQRLATFLGLDAQTVARGRHELLTQDVTVARVRRAGGGRPPVEKKRPKSSG